MISCYFSQYFSQILRLFPFSISASAHPLSMILLGYHTPGLHPGMKGKVMPQTITVHKRGKQKQSSFLSNATHHFPADTFSVCRSGIALFCLTPISLPVHCCAQLHQEFSMLDCGTTLLSVKTCAATPKIEGFLHQQKLL